ncbi:hypothetical protein GCK32_002553 [Trichostrongylus colubriformis]|uniref:Uncharacterized protein n=1 Tax=Trichostrongylus colubriformis TaxID=6319 RepID=A0AAN8FUL6_TRICO
MAEVFVGGVWVPSAIAQHFKGDEEHAPFSYTRPNLKFQSREVKLDIKTFQPHREQIIVEERKPVLMNVAVSKVKSEDSHIRNPWKTYSVANPTRPSALFFPVCVFAYYVENRFVIQFC